MSKQIDPIKKARYKQARLSGKDKKNSMLEAGYALSTAIQSPSMTVVKQSELEIASELKAKDITVEWVIEGLSKELTAEDSKASDRIRARELIGKWLNIFKDIQIQNNTVFTNDMIKDLPPIDATIDTASNNTIDVKLT